MKRPVIIVANPVFGEQGLSSTEEIAKELSQYRPVLFVNFPLTINQLRVEKERFDVSRSKHRLRKARGFDQLWVFEPPLMLPTNSLNGGLYEICNAVNNRRYLSALKGIISRLGWTDFVAVNAFNPFYRRAFLALQANHHVYYCYDNIDAAFWLRKHGVAAEQQLLPNVDRIIVSSPGLKEKFNEYREKVELVPNGMNAKDFPLLDSVRADALRLVYVGAIDDRIDYAFIHHILNAFPDATLTLAGPLNCSEAEELAAHTQITYLGLLPKEEVGKAMVGTNVGIIPFVTNEFTKFIYPLKINEYLSRGLAVLTTNFAPLDAFSEVVRPVDNGEQAIVELHRILEGELNEKAMLTRHKFASSNSWAARAKTFNDVLGG